MSMQLTQKERDKMIIDNIKLVYHMVKQLPHVNSSNYDDLVQIGRIGLIKAVSNFDETKGNKFSTYATRCIKNEIYMYFRKERPHNSDISINDVIYTDTKGDELELEDVLGNEDNLIEKMADKELITNVLNIIINVLEPKDAMVILYKISGIYTQNEIGEIIGTSQSYISRIKERAIQNIRKYIEREEKLYCPIFSIIKVGDFYRLSCNTRYASECLAKFLKCERASILSEYKVVGDDERRELWMPSYPETFAFIAEFIREKSNF